MALLFGGAVSLLGAVTVDPVSAMALCLFRIAQFTTWPAGAFSAADSPVVFAVVGREPFGARLDDMFRGERLGERLFVVKRCEASEDPPGCHMLLVGEVDEDRSRELLRQVAGRPVLTVSLRKGFCAEGGMMTLSVDKGRVQILIRRDAVQGARLAVDSRLLNLSKMVRIYGEPERP